MQFLGACATTIGLGFLYFISAIPTGAALKLPLWVAALCAWIGYSAGGAIIILAGAPLRDALTKRFKIQPHSENPTLVVRAWKKYGLPAMGLLAPVTIGPQIGALLGIALGEKKIPLLLALSLGAIPYAITFAALIHFGIKLAK
jgi:hypothetical protein